MQMDDINFLRSVYFERKRMLDEYETKKELCDRKKELYDKLKNDSDIKKFEGIRSHVINESTLLGFVVKENGTYDRILNLPKVKAFCDLEKEIHNLEREIQELTTQLIANRCLGGVNLATMQIDGCQHELCTMTGILSKKPTSILRKEAFNYETQESEVLYEAGFMPGDFFAYRCLDCNFELPIAVPIENVSEFESTHKIIYGFRHEPSYMQQRYYELLVNHSFDEAYQILKEEIERGEDYEYLKHTISTRKKEKQMKKI